MIEPIIITLTEAQRAYAIRVCIQRRAYNKAQGRPGAYGADRYTDDQALECDLTGGLAEAAVLAMFAPALRRNGIEPVTVWRRFELGDPRQIRGDVAGWEVRATARRWGNLPLHKPDADRAPFIFVVNRDPRFYVLGWILGGDGKRAGRWREDVPYPAWFVSPGLLKPIPGEWL